MNWLVPSVIHDPKIHTREPSPVPVTKESCKWCKAELPKGRRSYCSQHCCWNAQNKRTRAGKKAVRVD